MSDFQPKIVAFVCNWCSYAGADNAGGQKLPYSPAVKLVRVMCSGRVDPQFVLQAFREGADGVMVLGCHPGDCHYRTQQLGRPHAGAPGRLSCLPPHRGPKPGNTCPSRFSADSWPQIPSVPQQKPSDPSFLSVTPMTKSKPPYRPQPGRSRTSCRPVAAR